MTTRKLSMGSYVFQVDLKLRTTIKWEESNREAVLGIEPCAHLSKSLNDWGLDRRFTEPMRDVLGCEAVDLDERRHLAYS